MTDMIDEKESGVSPVVNESPMEAPRRTKYVVLIGDGMADYPVDSLGGATPLEAARTPAMDRLARVGEVGTVLTIPNGLPPGSDVANLSLMGYDPMEYYTGRGPIEAAAMGVKMNPEDVAFRCNLVTLDFREGRVFMVDYSAGHISTEEAGLLLKELQPLVPARSFSLHPGVSYRHLLIWKGGPEGISTVPPHDYTGQNVTEAWHFYEEEPLLYDILTKAVTFLHRHPVNVARRAKGLNPANSLWPWGQGRRPQLPRFKESYGLAGAVICAVDLIKGLGVLAGFEHIPVAGATGYLDTNYQGKADAALKAIEERDIVFVHVEAPDEAGHMGSAEEKVRAIERFDKEVVARVVNGLADSGHPFRVLVVTDHFTPVALRTHARGAVPFVIFDSLESGDNPDAAYSERAAKAGILNMKNGPDLMEYFLGVPLADRGEEPDTEE